VKDFLLFSPIQMLEDIVLLPSVYRVMNWKSYALFCDSIKLR